MGVPLDPVGNVSLMFQMLILFLLIIGLPSVRGKDEKKIALQHGYLTIIAMVLNTVLIFYVMIPTFNNGLGELNSLPPLYLLTVSSHVIFGAVAEVMGLIMVSYWIWKKPKSMQCLRMKRWMTPLFVIWVISVITGALIHILGML